MVAGPGQARTPGRLPKAFSALSRDGWIAGALIVVSLGWFSLSLDRTFDPRDEGHLLRLSTLVAAGRVPHRDFVDSYGPGVLGLTGAVVGVFGEQLLPVRIFVAVLKALAVAGGYLLSRTLATRPFALLASCVAIGFWGRAVWNLNAPYAALFTLVLTPWMVLALVSAERRRSQAGLFAAGVLAGVTLLFKHTLAAFLVFGMALALCASATFSMQPDTRTRSEWRVLLAAWVLAGALPVVAAWLFLTPTAYALHLLPIHAAMTVVAWAIVRRRSAASLERIAVTRLLPFGAGVAAVLAIVGALYAYWGALGPLVDDLFVLPLTLDGYTAPVSLPGRGAALAATGFLAASGAGLLALTGRRGSATGLAGVAIFAIVAQRGEPDAWRSFWLGAPLELRGLQSAVLAWAGIATLTSLLRDHGGREWSAATAWLSVVFLQAFMGFQAFPRAAFGLYLAQGVQAILMAGLLATWHARICRDVRGRARRLGVAALLALPVLWLVLPPVHGVLRGVATPEAFRALRFPQTQGLSAPRATIARRGIADMERVAAQLAAEPKGARLLLLGNDEMILVASGREPLLPRLRAHVFWAGWGMTSRRDREQVEEELLRALARRPDTLVVEADGPARRRVREAFPKAGRYVDAHYRVQERVGRYRILERTRNGS
jgi:hypothetical protein